MKQYLFKLTQVFLFCSVFYIFFIIIAGLFLPNYLRKNLLYVRGGNGHSLTRLSEVKNTMDVDILFIGSSRCYRGFDPRIFEKAGYKTFNLGSSNQTPVQSRFLLEKYLKQLNPALIIMEVNPDVFSNNGVESAIDIISNENMDFSLLKMAVEINDIKVWNTFIFALFSKGTGLENNFTEEKYKEGQIYIPGGYVQNTDQHFHNEIGNTYVCNLNKKQLKAFENIMTWVHASNIKILLVQSPVVASLYSACTENENFDFLMHQKAAYFNFNKILNLTDSLDFYDGQHLNQNGVEKLNGEILKIVMGNK